MKKLLILMILIFSINVLIKGNTGDRRVYCELIGSQKLMSSKVIVSVDFGQETSFWSGKAKQYLVDKNGKAISFNSMIDAMNFMGKLGWKFEQAYVVTTNSQNVYHWMLSKDIRNNENLEKGINTREKFTTGENQNENVIVLGKVDDIECQLIDKLNNGVRICTLKRLSVEQVKRVKKELDIKEDMVQLYLPGKFKRDEAYAGANNEAIFIYDENKVIELE